MYSTSRKVIPRKPTDQYHLNLYFLFMLPVHCFMYRTSTPSPFSVTLRFTFIIIIVTAVQGIINYPWRTRIRTQVTKSRGWCWLLSRGTTIWFIIHCNIRTFLINFCCRWLDFQSQNKILFELFNFFPTHGLHVTNNQLTKSGIVMYSHIKSPQERSYLKRRHPDVFRTNCHICVVIILTGLSISSFLFLKIPLGPWSVPSFPLLQLNNVLIW